MDIRSQVFIYPNILSCIKRMSIILRIYRIAPDAHGVIGIKLTVSPNRSLEVQPDPMWRPIELGKRRVFLAERQRSGALGESIAKEVEIFQLTRRSGFITTLKGSFLQVLFVSFSRMVVYTHPRWIPADGGRTDE